MDLWSDYDEYIYNSNYVDLKYTLRGIELNISSNSLKNGIFIYQNYLGNRNIQDLENVYITDKDLVFELEKNRCMGNAMNRIEQGENTQAQLDIYGRKFAIRFRGNLDTNETGYKGPLFYSRDRSYPDSELERTLVISSFKWYDDSKVIYSVDYEGLYVYNCETRVNAKIIDFDDEIVINEVNNNTIIFNDNEVLNVNIN